MSHTHARNITAETYCSPFYRLRSRAMKSPLCFFFPTLNICFALACVHHLLLPKASERAVCVSAEQQTDNKLVYRTAESNYRTRNYKHMKNGRLSDPTKYGFPFSLRASLILLHYATIPYNIYGRRAEAPRAFCYICRAACMSECQGDDAIN